MHTPLCVPSTHFPNHAEGVVGVHVSRSSEQHAFCAFWWDRGGAKNARVLESVNMCARYM